MMPLITRMFCLNIDFFSWFSDVGKECFNFVKVGFKSDYKLDSDEKRFYVFVN